MYCWFQCWRKVCAGIWIGIGGYVGNFWCYILLKSHLDGAKICGGIRSVNIYSGVLLYRKTNLSLKVPVWNPCKVILTFVHRDIYVSIFIRLKLSESFIFSFLKKYRKSNTIFNRQIIPEKNNWGEEALYGEVYNAFWFAVLQCQIRPNWFLSYVY